VSPCPGAGAGPARGRPRSYGSIRGSSATSRSVIPAQSATRLVWAPILGALAAFGRGLTQNLLSIEPECAGRAQKPAFRRTRP
jgi:hypothetical protein